MLQHVSDDLVDHMFGSIHNMVQQNVHHNIHFQGVRDVVVNINMKLHLHTDFIVNRRFDNTPRSSDFV